jgi:hypothetical protein
MTIAIALVIALEIWLAAAHPLTNVPIASLERSEIFQAVDSYRRQPGPADIILFGSSLMTAPVLQSEALYLNQPLPKFTHRNTHVLAKALERRLGREPSTFCLASGGQMASDVYRTTKNVLRSDKQPIAIIYGIAPRDFQDNLVPAVESTPVFQSLATIEDLPERLASGPFRLKAKVDLVLGRLSLLWRYKADMRSYLTLRMKKYMERFLPWVCFEKYNERHELKQQKRGLFPEEAAGVPTAWPGIALDHLTPPQMLADYDCRYNPVSKQQVAEQLSYFQRFLELCKQRGIAVLVVNMPLSKANKAMLAPSLVQDYLSATQKLCKQYEVDYQNLNQDSWDKADNFIDTVHLTPARSQPFMEELAVLAAQSQVALALKSGKATLAQRGHQL